VQILLTVLPSVGAILGAIVVLFVAHRILERGRVAVADHRFRNQLIMLGLTAGGILLVILVLPIGDTTRSQLLSLIGILLSAAIALSSTTFLGNAMAGVMLRAVSSFRIGDFIRTGEHFGRVSERGLFHTEIQTADRELTTLPNLYLVTHPVTTTRISGTIVSATVSLGYDVSRTRVEELLLEAARQAELSDPFVQILELGDYSVTYRVAGLLTEVKQLLSVRSRLLALVMDSLHRGGVEIVSPSFMNTRALPADRVFIPRHAHRAAAAQPSAVPEDVVFDKAEEAESLETLRTSYAKLSEDIAALEKRIKESPEETSRESLQTELSRMQIRKKRLEEVIALREAKVADSA
jgi:small-conductance mechanosensitive channel